MVSSPSLIVSPCLHVCHLTPQAQLRAAVFTAIDEQERKQGIYTPYPKVEAMKDSAEGIRRTYA